jgi:O-antigen/teichoic acid export membrane protein
VSVAKKAFKGSMTITLGEVINQGCSMLRNVVLARVLTKADFGTAALLGMSISVFEIGGRLSIEYCLVQSKEGDEPRFMYVAHFIQAMLGLLSGTLIFLTARPMAVFFGIPSAAWALQVLAVIPVLRSLNHLDIFRMNRHLRYGPGVLIDMVPQIVTTLAVWPLSRIWNSYVVLVWLFLAKQTASTLASHFVAERPYRWAYDQRIVNTILTFGWPMLINGFLFFGIMQGDRFAVGIKYSVSELGVYAIAGSLSLIPSATLLRLSGNILLPLMSAAQGNAAQFIRRLRTTSEIVALFSGVYAVVMILGGGPLVTLIFSAKYSESGALTAWLGTAQALRLLRNIPTIAAMAKGDSKNLMYSNLLRISGLALSFPLAMAGASLATIAACSTVGEAVALTGSFWRFARNHRVPIGTYLPAISLAAVFIALSALLTWLGMQKLHPIIPLGTVVVLVAAFATLHLVLFRESRQLLLSKILPLVSLRRTADVQRAPV